MENDSKGPTILAIDTSFDETAVAVTRGFTILSNLLPSQMEYHREFGGVVPSLAKLAHKEKIDNVVTKSMKMAKVTFNEIDVIAVTYGPGLALTLEIGINKARELAQKYNKPLVIVNHMEGHLLSSLARRQSKEFRVKSVEPMFPILGFLISGGHTELVLMKDFGDYEKIGETLDDSCGEAYDKCGRMLGLGYPAGPVISKFAKEHRRNTNLKIVRNNLSTLMVGKNKNSGAEYSLPIAMVHSNDLNFSFSGLKTAFSQLVGKLGGSNSLTKEQILDLCVVFEAAALEQLAIKLRKAIEIYSPREVWLGGGVVASARLRSVLRNVIKEISLISTFTRERIQLRYPYSKRLTGDNAVMIGIAAYAKINRVGLEHDPDEGIFMRDFNLIDRDPMLSF